MARRPRLALPGCAHHIQQQAVHGQALVVDDVDRQALRDALGAVAADHQVSIWAYALQDDTLNLLATPLEATSLSRMMQALGRRYVVAFNRRHHRRGALWGGRYGAAVIESGEYLLSSMVWIDGLVDPSLPWSSAPHRLGRSLDPLLQDPPELWTLGNTPFERELGYRQRLEAGVSPAQADALARAVRGGWAVGSRAFIAEVEAASGRPATARARGRPKRADD